MSGFVTPTRTRAPAASTSASSARARAARSPRRRSPRPASRCMVLEEGGHHTKRRLQDARGHRLPDALPRRRAARDQGPGDRHPAGPRGRRHHGGQLDHQLPHARARLEHWKKVHDVGGVSHRRSEAALGRGRGAPQHRRVGRSTRSNRNNRLLYDGCKALGLARRRRPGATSRTACRSGYCGMGCPVDAKQSMLITYLPDAVAKGATRRAALPRRPAERRGRQGRRASSAASSAPTAGPPTGQKASRVKAQRFVLSAGAIGTPAHALRSGLGGGMVGRRTFLHPVVGDARRSTKMPVEPYYGAPQSVASHHSPTAATRSACSSRPRRSTR